jgi:6-phosphogluconolactonase (cycloisomerase 2 family)
MSILYANGASGMVAFAVNSDGSLSALSNPQVPNIGPAIGASRSLIFGGDSALFGTTLASLQTSFPSGKLQLVSQAGFPIIGGTTINQVTVCGSQIFAGDINGALVAYAVGSQGQLTQAGQIVGFSGAPWSMASSSDCNFVYVSDTASANIYGYQNTGGTLSDLPGSPFAAGQAVAGKGLFGVSIDPSGKFLYVPNQSEVKLYGFAIGSDGTLTTIPGSPFSTGNMPVATAVVTVSSATFLYLTDASANTITSYRIGSATGSLTQVASVSTGTQPEYLVSAGTLLYSTNVQGSSISGFNLKGDGSMTPVPGSPFAISSAPQGGAVIATGQSQ